VRAPTWIVLLPIIALGVGACSKAVLDPRDYQMPVGAPTNDRGIVAARIAESYLGVPYVWSGASPSGFDCSGLVSYVYGRLGVSIPHNAAQQYRFGTPVDRGDLVPGDVVFFDRLRHNGIYVGDGRFVHAAPLGGVKLARLEDEWFRQRWVGARRL
jgi:peptidoglycan DL-endopeptidase CwlO